MSTPPRVHTVRPGQVYLACHPADVDAVGWPRHIRVEAVGPTTPGLGGFGKVEVVTLTRQGRAVRRRSVEATQLHASAVTRAGSLRRTGYVLLGGRHCLLMRGKAPIEVGPTEEVFCLFDAGEHICGVLTRAPGEGVVQLAPDSSPPRTPSGATPIVCDDDPEWLRVYRAKIGWDDD